jgi:voltage-gated potassium channel
MHLTKEQREALHPINIIVFFLSVYVIIALLISTFMISRNSEVHRLLDDIDHGVCVIFFIDFLHRFFTAGNKREYMKWGWIDLISSIPMTYLAVGRVFRVLQLIRVVRAVRSVRIMAHYFVKNRIRSTFASAAIFAFLMIVFCAIAMLRVEQDAPGSKIKTAEDALWWAYVTITTVGYGDVVPVTREGRVIAAVLMTVGVGLFGTFTAYVASWFVEKKEEQKEAEKQEEHLAQNNGQPQLNGETKMVNSDSKIERVVSGEQ